MPQDALHDLIADRLDGVQRRHGVLEDDRNLLATDALHAPVVAKGELARNDLTIYYFPEPKDGKADPRPLKIDEKGGVEGGLPGFFDQSLDELTEYLEALKQPKA